MKILEKIVISIVFALCVILFVQNISWADWAKEKEFKRNTYDDYNWSVRKYKNNGARLYITANIFIKDPLDLTKRKFGGGAKNFPKLDENVRSTLPPTWCYSRDN